MVKFSLQFKRIRLQLSYTHVLIVTKRTTIQGSAVGGGCIPLKEMFAFL